MEALTINNWYTTFASIAIFLTLGSCNNSDSSSLEDGTNTSNLTSEIDVTQGIAHTLESPQQNEPQFLLSDTALLSVSNNQQDVITNEYLLEEMNPIRANFKRLNSIQKWQQVDTVELWNSAEGGSAVFYYSGKELDKVIARNYGETQQVLVEYYLLDGELSFVFEKSFNYNRPIYWDSTTMADNNDDQVFDFEQSEILEDRSYFANQQLIHQLSNQDCGAPFSDDYLKKEQTRILEGYHQVISANIKE